MVKHMDIRSRQPGFKLQDVLLTDHMAMGKLLNLSMIQLPHLQNIYDYSIYLIGCCED